MEDNLAIKKARIAKLNGLNYRTWAIITRAIIEVKDAWNAIKLLGPEAKTSVKSTGDGIVKGKAARLSKANRVTDVKARIVIIGYYRLKALFKVLHLRTAKE
jgi:hypothetical protein